MKLDSFWPVGASRPARLLSSEDLTDYELVNDRQRISDPDIKKYEKYAADPQVNRSHDPLQSEVSISQPNSKESKNAHTGIYQGGNGK